MDNTGLLEKKGTDTTILELVNLSKSFSGLQAVRKLNLSVSSGQIKALIGPNGAGKTTTFNLVCGTLRPDSGQIKLKGRDITRLPTHLIARSGIGRTFQIVCPFHGLSVIENVMISREQTFSYNFLDASFNLPKVRREEDRARADALAVLETVGLAGRATTPCDILTLGQLKLLEVARALALNPELLLVDEPCGGLNETELSDFVEVLFKLRQKGLSILLIEHNVKMVMRVADQICVLNFGEKIAEGTPLEIQNNPAVIEAYLGE